MPTETETRASADHSSINTRLAARDFGAREKKLKAAENTNINRADTPMGQWADRQKKGSPLGPFAPMGDRASGQLLPKSA